MKSYGKAFELLLPEFDLTNICFYYIPKRLRDAPRDEEYARQMEKIAPRLYKILAEEGVLNIVAQNRGKGDTTFLKLPLMSSGITDEDVKYIVQVIDFYGKDL
jgi:hypothetical protein